MCEFDATEDVSDTFIRIAIVELGDTSTPEYVAEPQKAAGCLGNLHGQQCLAVLAEFGSLGHVTQAVEVDIGTTFDGDDSDVLNVLNIQPVWPFSLNEDWNLITRTIVPVISAPSPADDQINGVGDTSFTGWFSPSTPVHNITWGIGPVG